MGNELVTTAQPDPCTQLVQVSEHLAAGVAKMLQLDSVQEANVVLYTCLVDGITPIEFHRKYHIVKGKPAMRADAMLAEWRQRTKGRHKVVENSPTRAAIKLIDADGDEAVHELTWDEIRESRWPWKDQKADKTVANLKDNWSTPTDRRNMLWARLISNTIRTVAPEISAGAYTPEELEDSVARPTASSSATLASQFLDDNEAEEPASSPEPVDNSEAVDAEFEVKEDAEAPDPAKPIRGNATKKQLTSLTALIEEATAAGVITAESLQLSLEKRGVTAMNQLTKEQIAEMIINLEAALGK